MFINYFLEHSRYLNLLGITAIISFCYLISENRQKVKFKNLFSTLIAFLVLAFLCLKTKYGELLFFKLSEVFNVLYKIPNRAIEFVFGNLGSSLASTGFIFAFQVLPVIIFFGALMAILFHFGIIQSVVFLFSKLLSPFLSTSGPETLCAVSNMFLGQTEAPLLIKNYLDKMDRSEIMSVMLVGMATTSASILPLYAGFGAPLNHLIISSVLSVFSAVAISKLLVPSLKNEQKCEIKIASEKRYSNVFNAISTGTTDGLFLVLNVAAMIISFLALTDLIDLILSKIGFVNLSLSSIFSFIFKPIVYVLGFRPEVAGIAAKLIGIKVVVNEFIAFTMLENSGFNPREIVIMTYVLCGFSNFSCIGILIGGVGALCPSQKCLLSQLGLKALLGAALSNILTALFVGLFI